VVVDGAWVFAAGVTAGIDGALRLAAELRSDEVAQAIQLDIAYAPEPPFNSGTPETAPAAILEQARQSVRDLTTRREETAQRMATKLGVSIAAVRAGNELAGASGFGENRGRIGALANSRAPK
jgi:cyclohexyl-isocyanide hydratase